MSTKPYDFSCFRISYLSNLEKHCGLVKHEDATEIVLF